jgi:hypothetical protein
MLSLLVIMVLAILAFVHGQEDGRRQLKLNLRHSPLFDRYSENLQVPTCPVAFEYIVGTSTPSVKSLLTRLNDCVNTLLANPNTRSKDFNDTLLPLVSEVKLNQEKKLRTTDIELLVKRIEALRVPLTQTIVSALARNAVKSSMSTTNSYFSSSGDYCTLKK